MFAASWDQLRVITQIRAGALDFAYEYYHTLLHYYRNPWFWLSVGVIFALELLIPVVKQQRLFSRALLEDFLWSNLFLAFELALLPGIVALLQDGYLALTHGEGKITALAQLPLLPRLLLGLLFADLLIWLHHRLRHRPLLWPFHAVHHSQREMNQFTDRRVHLVDQLVGVVITAIPMFALQIAPDAVIAVAFVMAAQSRLIHANIRTNFGPLRHILVSPQYHRIHHSAEPQHQDKNFAPMFTIWDRCFGTLYRGYDEYPETGVPDLEFRTTHHIAPVGVVVDVASQFFHPIPAWMRRRNKTHVD